ncbi:hypothetical protein E6C60_0451 [Paenibacillus algicola]|uniref:Uncharacterized protein n=1 Tax=Paenibacillus algicola TaxID=2565926 RepID=A0A4V1G3H1_9BACL|nr:hypothetical protein E6C60_0451 [Paenibacillus algicola]
MINGSFMNDKIAYVMPYRQIAYLRNPGCKKSSAAQAALILEQGGVPIP